MEALYKVGLKLETLDFLKFTLFGYYGSDEQAAVDFLRTNGYAIKF
jgi:hypothetical protein